MASLLDSAWSDGGSRSHRHVINMGYHGRAFKALQDDPRFEWLWWGGRLRKTILAELGRVGDEDDIRALALTLCEQKPRTTDAIVRIRQWRLGRQEAGTADQLGDELCRAIDGYLARYPKTALATVIEALDATRDVVDALRENSSKRLAQQATVPADSPRVWSKRKGAPPYPKDAVYVGKRTPWGNDAYDIPKHLMKDYGEHVKAVSVYEAVVVPRELAKNPHWLDDLRGKHLLCWCAPLPCHADVLLRLANGPVRVEAARDGSVR